jgi:hypothetical protein
MCTGDKAFNKNYYTECKETENFVLVRNSCHTYLFDKNSDEEVEVGEMNKKELLQLLECVKDDIAEAEKEDKTLKSKLEKLTE